MPRAAAGATALAVLLGAALALSLLLPGLGTAPLDDPGEGQHAEIAREAWRSGDWLALRLNGVPYLDKPPLLYWLVGGAFALGGQAEWAARLAPALAAAAAVAGTVVLGARLLGPRSGFLAGAALCSCALFLAYGRYVRPDALFVAAIQWGLAGLLLGAGPAPLRRGWPGASGWALAGGLGLGAAALAKDPLGLAGPLAAVAAARALAGRLTPLRAWLPLPAVAVMLAVGGGWYLPAALAQPGFAWYTLVDNHLLNALGRRVYPDEDVPLSTLEFLAVAGLGAFPWVMPGALQAAALLRRRARREPDEWPWVALALWALGVPALFALLPFKLPHYGLPAYPALALLAARWWSERLGTPALLGHAAALSLGAAALGWVVATDGAGFTEAVFSAIDVATRKADALAQPSALPPWAALAPLVARTALVLGAGALALTVAAWRRAVPLGAPIVAATMLAAMPGVASALSQVSAGRSVAHLAQTLAAVARADDLVLHEGPIEGSGALEFYSGRRPVLVDARRSVLGIGATFPEARDLFWDAARVGREWPGPRRMLLVTTRAPGRSLVAGLPPGSARLVMAHNGRRLYANPAAAGAGVLPSRPAGG